ncbi:FtsX-like permease family protein [Gammaproteobacteria bacterium]|jgi:ABC-type lipoprotein release transport system permease subunit|nr:FtsX-like permease family protein [Gammaproteobacteria bacterium]
MSMNLAFQLSFRNIVRHRRRNAMLFAAVAVAVLGSALSMGLVRGWQGDMLDSAVGNLTGHIKVHAPGYRDDPSIQRGFELANDYQPEVPATDLMGWAPRIVVPAVILSERETRGIQLVGIDPGAESISFLNKVSFDGENLSDSGDARVIIGKELARQLKTRVGLRLVIMTQGSDGLTRERGFRIAGTYDAEGTSLEKVYVFSGLRTIQSLLDTNNVTEVSVRLNEEPKKLSIQSLLIDFFIGLEVLNWEELNPQAATLYLFTDTIIYILFIFIMGALIFGLVNTLIASVMERTKEFGMLRALGMNRRTIILQVVVESMLIMTIGTVFGLLFSYFAFLSLADGLDMSAWASGLESFGMKAILYPVLRVDDFVTIAMMSLVMGVLASYWPAKRAMRITPLEAMRT